MSDAPSVPVPSAAVPSSPVSSGPQVGAVPPVPPTPPTPAMPHSRLGIAAFVVGIIAFVSAIVPGVSFGAWLPSLVAVGLGIAGIVVKNRKKIFGIIGLGLGALALIVAIVVSLATVGAVAQSAADAIDDAAGTAEVDGGGSDTADDAPADDAPAEDAPAGDAGSSADNPAAAGTPIDVDSFLGKYTMTLGAVTWDAKAIVAAENQFNSPAESGKQYAIVSITFQNTGTDEVTPSFELISDTLIDPAGQAHELGTTFAVIPNDLSGATVPPGASVTGNALLQVPVGTTAGTWAIEAGSDFVFVTA